ncbi:hypothetical protein B9Z55_007951 [Caenorhabditis nigoni]|uniref:BTB domain-containing protein n=1 Tax=Caenorhabditis nigoni TaxID=1611254 RepID=A0A2G5VCK6_9PELO|nr:hypothetical protein B9Z55_007951 [Caenorhabditis nigoni]
MSDNEEKEFSISHVFNNINSMETKIWRFGDDVEHFGAKWKIGILKFDDGGLRPQLCCKGSQTGNWSINTIFDILVGEVPFRTGWQFEFNQNNMRSWYYSSYIPKKDFSKYGIEESATVEFHIKIIEMTGIKRKTIDIQDDVTKKSFEVEKLQKSMNFDDDVAKESSDVVLMVGDQKFYLSKLYLSFHSTYFKSLFSGNFSESEKSEIELKDIDPDVFQYFLELIYGISLVDDMMVMEVLKLADYFVAKTVIERCQEFLLNRSEQPWELKFQAALKYKMEKLKVKCYSEIKKGTDLRGLKPENARDYSQEDWMELFDKVVSFL